MDDPDDFGAHDHNRSAVGGLHRKHRAGSGRHRSVGSGSRALARAVHRHHLGPVDLIQPSPGPIHERLAASIQLSVPLVAPEVTMGAIGETNPSSPPGTGRGSVSRSRPPLRVRHG